MSNTVKIIEKDSTGHVTANYILSTSTTTTSGTTSSQTMTRLDRVPHAESEHGSSSSNVTATSLTSTSLLTFFRTKFLPVFLPNGYPHTVTADYTPYQIYDSLQAFASTIAGLLSARAVLQSLGFDSNEADSKSSSSTATYATLLSIAQSTISNLSTILFAHHASTRISAEVKYYRFLADIVNDAAFVLDCLSPSLPQALRVPALCLSSAFRAVCGVAGGSSKAVLSAHFAKNGNIGELNAKDGSQETVISLLGLWVGGVVVSRVDGLWATWMWLLVLLGLHLWFNYCAVKCVRLTGLNGARAGAVMSGLVQRGVCMSVDQIGREERLFDQGGLVKALNGTVIGRVTVGASLADLMRYVGGEVKYASGTITADHGVIPRFIAVFEGEQYLLWLDPPSRKVAIVLKENASTMDQLKAWCHAVRLCLACGSSKVDISTVLDETTRALITNNTAWPDLCDKIMAAGWDISRSTLETGPGSRYVMQ